MSTIKETLDLGGMTDIRTAWPEDLDSVAEIFAHYVRSTTISLRDSAPTRHDWGRRYWELAANGMPFLVAQIEESVLGMAFCTPWRAAEGYRSTGETTVYLAPEAAGRGIGRALLTALVGECQAAGLRELVAVVVDDHNEPSLKLHQSCGYTVAGRLSRVGRKHGRTLDTVLLQRSLTG
jgi:L-amino acid N-acyltransferase YncA